MEELYSIMRDFLEVEYNQESLLCLLRAAAFTTICCCPLFFIHKEIRKCLFFSVYCDFLRLNEMPFPLQE